MKLFTCKRGRLRCECPSCGELGINIRPRTTQGLKMLVCEYCGVCVRNSRWASLLSTLPVIAGMALAITVIHNPIWIALTINFVTLLSCDIFDFFFSLKICNKTNKQKTLIEMNKVSPPVLQPQKKLDSK